MASLAPPLGLKSGDPGLVTAACRAGHTLHSSHPDFPAQGLGQAAPATLPQPSLPAEPLLIDLLWVAEIVFQLLLTHLNPDRFSKSVLLPLTIPPLHILSHPPHVPTSTPSHTLLETDLWGIHINCSQSSPLLPPPLFLRLQFNSIHYRQKDKNALYGRYESTSRPMSCRTWSFCCRPQTAGSRLSRAS